MSGLPDYTQDDFAAAFQAHMPTGAVWPRDQDATQWQVVQALVPTYVRSWQTAQNLLVDSFPPTAVELLPEWESSLGLPDPCAGEDPTIAQRQAHVVARLTQQNGPSIASLTAFAAALGYTITIQEFAPSRFGRPFGGSFGGAAWAFAWQISTPALSYRPFQFGSGHFGDPFATWNGAVLQCEMARLAPAHTIVTYNYSGAAAQATWGAAPGWDVGGWAA